MKNENIFPDGGCMFCSGFEKMYGYVKRVKNGGGIFWRDDKPDVFRYCPMCARKLREDRT